ncbi:MAG: hypothetical protein WCH34_03060 [Bacteroidota bacterium]
MNQKKITALLAFIALFFILIVYSNHFYNSFHFDDNHTIENNPAIRSLSNFTQFFTDARTLTPHPENQVYRPLITLSYAIDYKLNGGLKDTLWFHLSNFFWFLMLLVVMFFFYVKVFNQAVQHKWNYFIALFGVCWFATHAAIAETVNYICARSDSYSTFFVVLAFVMYIFWKPARRFYLYLIPFILSVLLKPTGLMFAPILFVYILLFDKELSFFDVFKPKRFSDTLSVILKSLPVFILAVLLYYLQSKMTPPTFLPSNLSVYNYMISQPFVWLYYVKSFFIPNTLSADYDWVALTTIWNWRFFVGMLFIIIMLVIGFITSKKKSTRPIAFGIMWFFLALIPSSTIVPFAEILNDHRVFYPYVGLMISVCWAIFLLLRYYENEIRSKLTFKLIIIVYLFFILGANAYATHQRNKVWKTEESLWLDVTQKSPGNGRGLMNYGLSQMAIGKYDIALEYFQRAVPITPYYSSLYVNLGIVKGALGRNVEAEEDFKKAMAYGANEQAPYYFYANYLVGKNRSIEALPYLQTAVKNGPSYLSSRYLLMQLYNEFGMFDQLSDLANQTLQIAPGDATAQMYLDNSKSKAPASKTIESEVEKNPTAEGYLNLSLTYYQQQQYEKCIAASEKALLLKPDFAEAYNNICAACNSLGQFAKAKSAGENAIRLKPDYELAKNNLKVSLKGLNK